MLFKLNGSDFSDCLVPSGLRAEMIPVYASQVTTLDGIKHTSISRWKSKITVSLLPMREGRAAELYEQLSSTPISVQYHNPLLGANVTQNMEVSSFGILEGKINNTSTWWKSLSALVLEEN